MVFDIDHRAVLRFFKPLFPLFFGRPSQKIFFGKAFFVSKLLCSVTGQHHVGSFFHYLASNGNGVSDILHIEHCAAISLVIHDTGVQGDLTIAVRALGT